MTLKQITGRKCVLVVTFQQVHELMAMANLVVEIAVLAVIALSLWFRKRRMFVWHGNTMLVAVIITGLLLIAHMGPSVVSVTAEAVDTLGLVSILGMIHGVVGATAIFLGLWLVGMWAFIWSETGFCARRRKLMRRILVFWLFALGLGITYYGLHIGFG